ncbi:MAG TPA: hypothetical protein VM030_03915 [Acidimicrobiales bacterium]|nr:hypothetical protein [Acidimicrobiales bacterium]
MGRWRLPLVVFLLVAAAGQAAVGMRASRTATVTGDEPFYLLTAQSLTSDGDLDLRDEYAGHEEGEFWDGTIPLWKQMTPAPDGRLLSPHDPGLPLLIVPAYAVGGLTGVQRFLVLLWALAMALAAVAAVRLGVPTGAAGLAAVALGAGAPGVVYASQVYPEGPAALLVAIGLLLAIATRPRPVALAAAMTALMWLGVKYAPFAAVLGGVWVWRFRADRRAVAALAGLAVVAAAHLVWWHLHTFGDLTPYGTNVVWSGEGTASIVADHVHVGERLHRLYGVLVDQRFGLLRWSPVAALVFAGLARRRGLALALVLAAVALATFASITMMGWWFPGRMLVAAFPAVVVLTGAGIARFPRVGALLAGWSLAIGAAVAVGAHTGAIRLAVDPWRVGFPLPPAILFPDLRTDGTARIAASAAWVVGLTMLGWRSSWSSTATPSSTAPSSPSPPTWPPPPGR